MDTTQAFLLLAGGLALLIVGAQALVTGASKIGIRLGMRPITVGATIVAFGTSAPEFLVSIVAGLQDEPGIAIGNLVGSNIANIGLVLGIAAAISKIDVRTRGVKFVFLTAALVTLLVPVIALDSIITAGEGGGLLVLTVTLVAYYILRVKRADNIKNTEEPRPAGSPYRDVLYVVGGLAALIFGSQYVIDSAITIATTFGFAKAAVAATVIAIGTSLPEIATSVVAARRGQSGMVLGNVLGSNVFNLVFVLGPAAFFARQGLHVGDLEKAWLIPMMVGMTAICGIFMYTRRELSRLEGAALLVLYAVCLLLIRNAGGAG